MESAGEDKKFQSCCCKLAPPLRSLERKESPVNPYNRSAGSKISPNRASRDTDDNEINLVNSLLQFDCGPFPKSYLDTCSCSPSNEHRSPPPSPPPLQPPAPSNEESRNGTRNCASFGCCEMHWNRRQAFHKIKARVEHAIRKHKIFLIRGELPKLKEALEERGWLQKYETTKTRSLPYGSATGLETARSLGNLTQPDGSLNERAIIFALLRHKPPDFIWDCRNDFVDWHPGLASNTLLNRYQKPSVYTSKLGMARLLEEAHWLNEKNVASVLFPRSYNPSREPEAFLEDFRLTAATGLLKWFVQSVQQGQDAVYETEQSPSIPTNRVEFAVNRCNGFVARASHQNIDEECADKVSDEEWDDFLNDHNAIVHGGSSSSSSSSNGNSDSDGLAMSAEERREKLQVLYDAAVSTLEKVKSVDPQQYDLNGTRNVWILKPSDLCCGAGISISHNVKDILRRVKTRPRNYFIVQKYIERPLLIQETKFDIRQWYLVTSTFPLTIWLFKEGFLRFSSKPYTFSTYHEAIHICNTAVQEKYEEERRRRERERQRKRGNSEEVVKSVRDQGWDCERLNEYLKELGHEGEPYYERIYPRMAEAIVLTMLAAQEHMDRRSCSFELYGADFVITEDLSVWLIEINTNPRMHPPSSRISKRLYANVLESLVKVVTDLPQNPNADTGGFALVYKQNVPEFRPYLGPCLFVFGKSISVQEQPRKRERRRKGTSEKQAQQLQRAWTAPPIIPRLRDPKVVDFIDCLNAANCTLAK